MTFAQIILRAVYPKNEQERMEFRLAVARATAEAEDLVRAITGEKKPKPKPNGKSKDM